MQTLKPFRRVVLLGRHQDGAIVATLLALVHYLQQHHYEVSLDETTAELLPHHQLPVLKSTALTEGAELIIVVGGDGSMIYAAHLAVNQELPVLGINRGKLGFLTDIHPDEFDKVKQVLEGHYQLEQRFMLQAQLSFEQPIAKQLALNDVVLFPGEISHMIEFEVAVNGQFICSHRADGLIVATPTGSTAHAMSGGGPILHPQLNAVVLVPMFPHTLSSRPIVVGGDDKIVITTSRNNEKSTPVSCDGQKGILVPPGGSIVIQKHTKQLQLVHPRNYSYFEMLRNKLHWRG